VDRRDASRSPCHSLIPWPFERQTLCWKLFVGHRVYRLSRYYPIRSTGGDEAHISAGRKDLAPSDELRRWFGDDSKALGGVPRALSRRTRAREQTADLSEIRERAKQHAVTLLSAAKDTQHNNARALASLDALAQTGARAVLVGQGAPLTAGVERAVEEACRAALS
jgi:uncharacterized protein YeaO (DUF488 family)